MKLGPQHPQINSISKICGNQENNSGIFTDMFYCDSNRCVLAISGSLWIWNLLFLLFVGGVTSHESVKVTAGTQCRNALIREAGVYQEYKGRRDYCTRARFTLDLIWQQRKYRVPVLPCPSVFTTLLSKAFQVMPPPCFSCSLSPQLLWGDPLTELSHRELGTNKALTQSNWAHLLINRAQRSLTPHSPLPSLPYSYLCRPLRLCSWLPAKSAQLLKIGVSQEFGADFLCWEGSFSVSLPLCLF